VLEMLVDSRTFSHRKAVKVSPCSVNVSFHVLTAASVYITSWDMAPCSHVEVK
jgi:hypothetical protein